MVFQLITVDPKRSTKKIDKTINTNLALYNALYNCGGHFLDENTIEFRERVDVWRRIALDNDDASVVISESAAIVASGINVYGVNQFLRRLKHLCDENKWLIDSTVDLFDQKTSDDFERCKSHWFRQKKYAHFTLDALFDAGDLLRDCLECIQLAKTKNSTKFNNYEKRLANLELHIQKEREHLAEALFYRIRIVFYYHSLRDRQPVFYLMEQLNHLGLNTIYEDNHQGDRFFDNEEVQRSDGHLPIAKAYAYIIKHGSESLKRTMLREHYFGLNGSLGFIPLQVIEHKNQSFFVPITMKKLIPKKLSFWTQWIPGYKARYEFMHSKTDLLFLLIDARKASMPHKRYRDLKHPYWQRLLDIQQHLDRELNVIAAKKRPWYFFLDRKNKALVSAWKDIMTTHQRELTRKQIEFLEGFNNESYLGADYLRPSEKQERIVLLKEQMTRIQRDAKETLTDDYCSRLEGIRKVIYKHISDLTLDDFDDQGHMDRLSLLSQLANENKPIKDDSFRALTSEIQLGDCKKWIDQHQALFPVIVENMIQRIRQLPPKIKKNRGINEENRYLLQTAEVLKNVLPLMEKNVRAECLQALKQALFMNFSFFPNYFKELSPSDVENRKQRFKSLQSTIAHIISLDPDLMREEKSLYQKVESYLDAFQAGRNPQTVDEILEASRRIRIQIAGPEPEADAEPFNLTNSR